MSAFVGHQRGSVRPSLHCSASCGQGNVLLQIQPLRNWAAAKHTAAFNLANVGHSETTHLTLSSSWACTTSGPKTAFEENEPCDSHRMPLIDHNETSGPPREIQPGLGLYFCAFLDQLPGGHWGPIPPPLGWSGNIIGRDVAFHVSGTRRLLGSLVAISP